VDLIPAVLGQGSRCRAACGRNGIGVGCQGACRNLEKADLGRWGRGGTPDDAPIC
jgi:hypothetical protein